MVRKVFCLDCGEFIMNANPDAPQIVTWVVSCPKCKKGFNICYGNGNFSITPTTPNK